MLHAIKRCLDKNLTPILSFFSFKNCCLRIFGLILVFVVVYYNYIHPNILYHRFKHLPKVNLQYVTVHIDLKGAPPKMGYLMSLLPDLKELGVNSLLMEYEDMFPYEGIIVNISTPSCYTRKEVTDFLVEAAELEIEVIPLVQVYGNMEHVFKLKEFQHLRESPAYPDTFCPLKDYFPVISEMLTQVITLHKNVSPLKHIHIGCKDANHLILCEDCKSEFRENSTIFMTHIKMVGQKIQELSPKITILVWDDILRKLNEESISYSISLAKWFKIEPVVQDSSPMLSKTTDEMHTLLDTYHKVFRNIWIAPAFRGVDTVNGRESVIPNIKNRMMNNLNWLHLIHEYAIHGENKTFDFKGIILSGWSRNKHFAPLNELLPVSLVSLTSCLKLIQKFKVGITNDKTINKYDISDWSKVSKEFFADINIESLICKSRSRKYKEFQENSPVCRINNIETNTLNRVIERFEEILNESKKTYKLDPEMAKKFSYTHKQYLLDFYMYCQNQVEQLDDAETNSKYEMVKYFDKYTIEEYLGFRTYSVKKALNSCSKSLPELLEIEFWKRGRDLPKYNEFLKDLDRISYHLEIMNVQAHPETEK